MKNLIKQSMFLLFTGLIAVNIYIFVSSIRLSSTINTYENSIEKLDLENKELENKSIQVDSLQYAASLAAKLKFQKDAQPLYLKTSEYAFRP